MAHEVSPMWLTPGYLLFIQVAVTWLHLSLYYWTTSPLIDDSLLVHCCDSVLGVYCSYFLLFYLCYVLVERSARLELDGYDSVVWHVVFEASASDTRWGLMDFERMDGTGLRGRGRYPRRTRCSGGICMFCTSRLDWHENSDLRSKFATGTT